jgi:hypothetical protein
MGGREGGREGGRVSISLSLDFYSQEEGVACKSGMLFWLDIILE